MELASLCLVGIFWLGMFVYGKLAAVLNSSVVLGVYLATSAAQTADVECFSTDGSQTVLSDQISNCQCFFFVVLAMQASILTFS